MGFQLHDNKQLLQTVKRSNNLLIETAFRAIVSEALNLNDSYGTSVGELGLVAFLLDRFGAHKCHAARLLGLFWPGPNLTKFLPSAVFRKAGCGLLWSFCRAKTTMLLNNPSKVHSNRIATFFPVFGNATVCYSRAVRRCCRSSCSFACFIVADLRAHADATANDTKGAAAQVTTTPKHRPHRRRRLIQLLQLEDAGARRRPTRAPPSCRPAGTRRVAAAYMLLRLPETETLSAGTRT